MLRFTDEDTISESLSNLVRVTQHQRFQSLICLIWHFSQEEEAEPWRHGLSVAAKGQTEGVTGVSQLEQLPLAVWYLN